jgi:hypothetical protein
LIAQKINKLKQYEPSKYQELKAEVLKMKQILNPYHLDIKNLKHKVEVTAVDFILFIFVSPFAALGYLLNQPPFFLAELLASKSCQNATEFYLSVRFTLGTFFWIFWVVLLTSLLFLFTQLSYFAFLCPFFVLLTYQAYLTNHQRLKLIKRLRWIKKMKSNHLDASGVQEEIRKVLKLRASLDLIGK